MSAPTTALPVGLQNLTGEVADLLGASALEVFGGAALDLLQNPDRPVRDLDVALRCDRGGAGWYRQRLAAHPEVTDVTELRDYWVHYRRPVVMFEARWRGMLLDINLMDHTPQCHFDAETVLWRYPQMTVEDPHGVTGRPVTRIRLVTGLDDDNPVLLLNRVIKLAAKYNLALHSLDDTLAVAGNLSRRAAAWASPDDFHGRQAHDAHHRAIARAVAKATDPAAFLRWLRDSRLLDVRLPRLAAVLRADPPAVELLAATATAGVDFWAAADRIAGDDTGTWRSHDTWLTDHTFDPIALEAAA